MPILSNLLLETDKGFIRISATDLELAIATTVPATIEQQGSFTIPAKLFQDFVHQNPDSEVSFLLKSSELTCTSEQVTATIPGIDPEEYPPLPVVKETTEVVLGLQDVVDALKQVVIACAQDQGRPVLTGVLTKFSPEGTTFAATDSFRLVERHLPKAIVSEEREVLIPVRTIQELIRIAGQLPDEDQMKILLSDNQLVIQVGGVEMYSRLLTGNFPKYQAIIPKDFLAIVRVSVTEFSQALRLTTVFSTSGITNVIIDVSEEGSVTLSNYATQRGGAKHTLKTKLELGFKPVKAAFNTRYLLDALGVTGESEVELQISGKTSPLVVSVGSPDYTQLVMPIRLDA
jgi:DNA polymerase-3 subunit beta